MLGHDSYFITGTDEHGDKIAQAAGEHGTSPQEYADKISGIFKETWTDMGIGFNDFIRTTEKRPTWRWSGTYCKRCTTPATSTSAATAGFTASGASVFSPEKEMVDGACPDDKVKLEFIEEKNYFFRMGKYQEWLIDYIEKNPDFIRPERYRNEVMALLKSEALEDLCISRPKTRLQWGITLPFDENYVTYVWFDVLINYLTGLGFPDGPDYPRYWPSVHHLIAKDILKPHAIYWPTILKAAGLDPFRGSTSTATGRSPRARCPRSPGNVVEPLALTEFYGVDQVRYFFLREMVYGLDATFSEEALRTRINSDLANDLGNLFARSLGMAFKYRQGVVPAPGDSRPEDVEVAALARETTSNSCGFSRRWSSPRPWPRSGSSWGTSTATSWPPPPGSWPRTPPLSPAWTRSCITSWRA